MPLLDKVSTGDKKAVKNPPRPKREFSTNALVYRSRIDDLRKTGKEHNDVAVLYVLLDTLHALIPVAEENYQEYPFHTNAAAVNHLTNQLRETLSDIRAYESFEKRGDLISDFVGTQYKQLLMAVVGDLFTAQKSIQGNTQPLEKELDRFRTTLAKRFSESERVVRDRVTQLLHVKT